MGSWGAIYNHTRFALQTQLADLARLQEQVTSGSRVNRPSDAPTAARRIMYLQSQVSDFANYARNIGALQTTLGDADNALQAVSATLTDVRGKLTQAATGTLSQAQRNGIAEGINQALEAVLTLANHSSLGRYIFGGTAAGQPPYVATRQNDRIVSVAYQGNYEDLPVPLAPTIEQSGLMVGERIFRGDARGTPEFLGATGAVAGTGTSNARGDVWLSVAHAATTIGGGIGLAAGDSSASGDTIIGSHQLLVDADARTLKLDDGQAVSYTPGDTDVRLTNAAGEVLHVNVSDLALGAGNQTVTVTATAKLSIDGGATWTQTDLTQDNLQVVDSTTGRFLYVDTRGIERAGLEPVRVGGTYDLFGTLVTVRDLIANSRGMPSQQQFDLMNKAVSSLDEVSGALGQQMVVVGSRLQAADTLQTDMEMLSDAAQTQIAQEQDADITDLTIQLAKTQTLYEMTLAATSKLLGLSLLDFLD